MTNPDTSGILRFLTDQLQEAEDAGDRGLFYFQVAFHAEFSKNLLSMDHWTRPFWVGWHQSIIEPVRSVLVLHIILVWQLTEDRLFIRPVYQMYVPQWMPSVSFDPIWYSVDRFSPHVIASTSLYCVWSKFRLFFMIDIFWGHTHEDQFAVRVLVSEGLFMHLNFLKDLLRE